MKLDSRYEEITLNIDDVELKFVFPIKVAEKEWPMLPHMHLFFELHFVFDGVLYLKQDDTVTEIPKGRAALIAPKIQHMTAGGTDDCKGFNLLFAITKAKSSNGTMYDHYIKIFQDISVFLFDETSEMSMYIGELIRYIGKDSYENDVIKKSLLTLAFIDVARQIVASKKMDLMVLPQRGKTTISDMVEFHLERFFCDNYMNNITVDDFASYIGFSTSHTARIIKQKFGKPFSKVLLELKMRSAKEKILSSDKALAQIAEEVGYKSYNGFVMAFKSYFGISPTVMKNNKENDMTEKTEE